MKLTKDEVNHYVNLIETVSSELSSKRQMTKDMDHGHKAFPIKDSSKILSKFELENEESIKETLSIVEPDSDKERILKAKIFLSKQKIFVNKNI